MGAAATGRGTDGPDALRARLAVLSDLRGVLELMQFDQDAIMPPDGGPARAEQLATLSGLVHDLQTDPALLELLDEAGARELDGDDDAIVRVAGRDADKATRVPGELVRELARAASTGQEAWARARASDDFAAFRPHLERAVELRREYAACFQTAEPYDALLDDYEPGMRTDEVRAAFAPLRAELPALVAGATDQAPPLRGPFAVDAQRRAVRTILDRVGFDDRSWHLGESAHPFSASPGRGDSRITTRYATGTLDSVLSALHEFGHGLYEAQIDPALDRTPLARGCSMAVHESQSRLWELFVGMSPSFWRGAWPDFTAALGGAPDGLGPAAFAAALAAVRPALIRVESDAVSYPLHIVLRFDLELALLSGDLAAVDLPAAWRDQARELLGVEVSDDRTGALQDVHWSVGAFGYFPTYALGTVLAAQLWAVAREQIGDLDGDLERGDLEPLRSWLADRVHRHGRRMEPGDLIRSATGSDLDAGPYLDFARAQAGGAQ